jgi:hypothetical protein
MQFGRQKAESKYKVKKVQNRTTIKETNKTKMINVVLHKRCTW